MYSKQAIRRKAGECLRNCGIENFPVDLDRVADALGVEISYQDMENKELSGLLSISDAGAIIVVNSLHHPNRQRFTIAHEIGHYILHASQGTKLFLDATYHRSSVSSEGTDPIEVEANRFAAEILMPIPFLKQAIEEEKDREMLIASTDKDQRDLAKGLSAKFGVSPAAISIRLGDLLLS
jgi:Zn-dependent peptidase ImmA (M78 family)